MATSRQFKVFFLGLALFLCISAATLASLRFGSRVPNILAALKPNSAPYLSKSQQRPLLNSSMAPQQYRRPPQPPPQFSATKESLIADTKRLVSVYLKPHN